ncbi:unnamed protein product [Adineta steineri]|uniref:G-protein coupled receptors family 1 profile domain-containing protein n=1 Tax=Adineta steineri TaxID=433720 RepID=A0A813ZDS4_9BILA|nr:unnamed protein product [Adineta steineri]CAF4186718.1 unnamed protein product [Adineta steineri]
MVIVIGVVYTHILVQYENTSTVGKCYAGPSANPLFTGIWNLIIFSLGPSIIMLIFGSLTIRHVQHSVGRVNASHITTKSENASAAPIQEKLQRQKTADRQLIRMMIAQCAYFAVLTTPISGSYIYISLTINTVLDDLQFAQVNLFTNIAGLLSTTGACTSFFVFTLSSKLFRHELKHLFTWRWR